MEGTTDLNEYSRYSEPCVWKAGATDLSSDGGRCDQRIEAVTSSLEDGRRDSRSSNEGRKGPSTNMTGKQLSGYVAGSHDWNRGEKKGMHRPPDSSKAQPRFELQRPSSQEAAIVHSS